MAPGADYRPTSMSRRDRTCDACGDRVSQRPSSQWVELRIGRLRPRRSFHKACRDRIDPKQRIAWQDRAWRTTYRSSGTMFPGSSLSAEERSALDRRLAGTATEDDYRL